MGAGSYRLIDMRGDQDVAYGMVPGAIHMPAEGLVEAVKEHSEFAGQKLVIYCTRGRFSVDAAAELEEAGYEAYSLGGRLSELAYGRDETGRRDRGGCL